MMLRLHSAVNYLSANYGCYVSRGEYCIGGFFGNHIYRTRNKEPRNPGKYGSVNNPQAAHAMYAKVTRQHAASRWLANRTRAGSMMTPRVRAYELLQLLISLEVFPR